MEAIKALTKKKRFWTALAALATAGYYIATGNAAMAIQTIAGGLVGGN